MPCRLTIESFTLLSQFAQNLHF